MLPSVLPMSALGNDTTLCRVSADMSVLGKQVKTRQAPHVPRCLPSVFSRGTRQKLHLLTNHAVCRVFEARHSAILHLPVVYPALYIYPVFSWLTYPLLPAHYVLIQHKMFGFPSYVQRCMYAYLRHWLVGCIATVAPLRRYTSVVGGLRGEDPTSA